MCRLYAVTRGGYYAWRHRRPSARSEENQRLLKCIERAHAQSHETYGSPRIQRALCVQGVRVGRNRVARLMRKHQSALERRGSIAPMRECTDSLRRSPRSG